MQRKRVALVLEHDAGARLRDRGKSLLDVRIERSEPRRARCGPSDDAELGAVAADRRQLQRSEDEIELAHWSAAHKSDSPLGALRQPRQRVPQRVRYEHLARSRSEVENRSVHVEQNGKLIERGWERQNGI